MKITISKQFQDLIYPLTNEELAVLEQSILKHGVRDPLVVWENGRNYLIDGHHRKQLIDRHKITKYRVTKLRFNSRHEVINWIIDNQLGRRNATPEGISYLRGLRYRNEKQQHGTNRHTSKSPHNGNSKKTVELLAEQYKVGKNTILRDEAFADAVESIVKVFPTPSQQKDIKHQILTRQINLSKKDIIELSQLSASYTKQVLSHKKELWQIKLEIEQRRKKKKKKPVRIVLPKEIKMYHGDCIDVMKTLKKNSIDAGLLDPPYGIGMMGKEWDNFTPSQIDRYGLIEQAGFAGNRCPAMVAASYDLSYEGGKKYQKWCAEWGKELLRIVKPGGHILCFCSPRMYHRLSCGLEDVGWQVRSSLVWIFGTGFFTSTSISQQIDKMNGKKGKIVCENPSRKGRLNWNKKDKNIVAPSTPEAEDWDGWYNNIKSSFEPILLARKPLSEKTLAENVLKWGTAGLNIDACRIPDSGSDPLISKGRFPSNVMLSEEASEELNRQTGHNVSPYFYCPKPSMAERNLGCEDLPPKKQNSEGNIRTYNDRCGRCGKKFIGPQNKRCQCPVGDKITDKTVYTNPNNHPTVKPVDLLQRLTLLLCRHGGTVIDCFAGSGTTGMACAYNGFKFIGIEKEKEYYQIARRRIMAAYRERHK